MENYLFWDVIMTTKLISGKKKIFTVYISIHNYGTKENYIIDYTFFIVFATKILNYII